ncbi:MAG TPA: flagellar motor stator protein MotA [Patescibacteria group bacterium]|nr:flagellar motor stator protein MotA [Patescibacteria group bacterium]
MFVIIGTIVVFGSIALGYALHGGEFGILFQYTEFIIIGGAAAGTLLIANPLSITKSIFARIIGSLKGSSFNKDSYLELLKLLYELFQLAKREGLIALEPHIENPEGSAILSRYPTFQANHHAVEFLCDTLKVLLNGGIPAHDLEELMDLDLETLHHAETQAPSALTTVGDALPGLGIVAAVLGVVITMGKIDQPPAVIGHSVAAALVGTFLGILLSYGLVAPLAKNIEHLIASEHSYMNSIKASLLSFAKGAPAVVAVEYGRRAIDPEHRPSFKETEEAVKQAR